MLLVRTEVRPSLIHGLGLFAAEPIPEGTIVTAWDARFVVNLTEEQRASLPEVPRAFTWRYGWRSPGGEHWLLSLDDSRFLNHSDTPNLSVKVTAACAFESRAVRDVDVGEELTEDYRSFDPDFAEDAATWTTTDRRWVSREEHETAQAEAAAMRRALEFALQHGRFGGGAFHPNRCGEAARLADGALSKDAGSRLLAELRARRVLDEKHAKDCVPWDSPDSCTCGLAERQEEARRELQDLTTTRSS